jgi:hypothetical protein
MGDYEKVMLTSALLTNWREANGRGLFDKHGNYQVEVSRGRGVVEKMMFELIVPGKIYPPGSNQLANVRLILADRRRTDEESITSRERAAMEQLKKMIGQKTNIADRKKWEAQKMNDLGQTKEQETTLWQKDMDAAGEAGKKLPSIRIFDFGIMQPVTRRHILQLEAGIAPTSIQTNHVSSAEFATPDCKKDFPLAVTGDFKVKTLGPNREHKAYGLEVCFRNRTKSRISWPELYRTWSP